MQFVKDEFEKRRAETEEYLNFVYEIISQDKIKATKTSLTEISSSCRHSILKANVILMLYNMIESTASSSISVIYQKITDCNLTFEECDSKIRNVLLNDIKRYVSQKSMFMSAIVGTDTFFSCLYNAVSENKEFFSGNVDAKSLREIAEKYGITFASSDFGKIKIIKESRNALAHGDKSFNDLGKNITENDLIEYYNQSVTILNNFIEGVQEYLKNEDFRDKKS